MLGIPCVGWRGCELMLEVMANTCFLYDIQGQVLCKGRGPLLWRVKVYTTFKIFQPPVA